MANNHQPANNQDANRAAPGQKPEAPRYDRNAKSNDQKQRPSPAEFQHSVPHNNEEEQADNDSDSAENAEPAARANNKAGKSNQDGARRQ